MLTKKPAYAGFFMPVIWALARHHQIITVN